LDIHVSRENIFDDSLKIVNDAKPLELTRKLFIRFDGEEGLDYGGMSREWFLKLSQEIFSQQRGLFTQQSKNQFYQISRFSQKIPEFRKLFKFVGRAMGMAVYHGKLLYSRFSLPFYKALLGRSLEFDDLKEIDETIHTSLTKMLDAKNVDQWGITFTIGDTDNQGNIVYINLREHKKATQPEKEKGREKEKPKEKEKVKEKEKEIEKEKEERDTKNDKEKEKVKEKAKESETSDSDVEVKSDSEDDVSLQSSELDEEQEKYQKKQKKDPKRNEEIKQEKVEQQTPKEQEEDEEEEVTNETKKEYVDSVIAYYLNSTSEQMSALREGFLELVPQDLLDELEPHELELMLFGQQEIDYKDLQDNTEYQNGFSGFTQTPVTEY